MEETIQEVEHFFSRDNLIHLTTELLYIVIQIIATVIVFYIIKRILERVIDFYFDRWQRENRRSTDQTLRDLLQNTLQYTYYFVLMYSILSILGVPMATLVAGAGIMSLAIGLGAQGFVSDVVNGFFIQLEKQYRVGDYIHVGGHSGRVKHVGLRMTVLEDWEHYYYYIPHRNIAEVVNESVKPIRYNIDFNVYPETNFKDFERVVEHAVETADPEMAELLTEPVDYYGAARDKYGHLVYRVRLHSMTEDSATVDGYYTMHISQELTRAGIVRPLAFGNAGREPETFAEVAEFKGE